MKTIAAKLLASVLFALLLSPALFATDYRYTKIDPPSATSAVARGINARGDILGDYVDADGVDHDFLFHKGIYTNIDYPGGAGASARALNARGDIVGVLSDDKGNHGFLLSDGKLTKLDYPADGAKIDPHTPLFDHDGILWFTNEENNYIGRLDPKTGKMTLTKLPTPHAVPYGIVILQNNTPFFCEFGTNKLASIDPSTMRIREYSLPAAGARPRRIALAPDGTVYYTDFARGFLGHFDPSSGKLLKEWLSPGDSESEPYGIAITHAGEVWYSESGVRPNTLVKFDPKSESFSTKAIPSGGGVVRNMVATPDRRLYLACSGVNKVAVVDLTR